MAEVDLTTATCARHGNYTVLFKRPTIGEDVIPLAETSVPPSPPGAAYQQQVSYAAPAYSPPYSASRNVGPCQNHPQMQALHYCSHCSARICAVCDFTFPGNIHFCPRCIMNASGMSPTRKNLMIAAYCLAGSGTLLMGLSIAAQAGGNVDQAVAITFHIIEFIVAGCLVVGAGLAFGAINRSQANPVSLWMAALWNGALAGLFVVLRIVSFFMNMSGE
jgi:hypothetical protein